MKTALVTGSNRGIGLEYCKQLRYAGWEVLAVCRKPSDALSALGVRVLDGVDVATDEGRAKLKDLVGDAKLDLLVNNAGIYPPSTLEDLNPEGMREGFEVNAMAPILLSVSLLDKLNKNAKIAMVTSRMGSIADNSSGGSYAYRMSKTALNAAAVSLAVDLKEKGISVVILHPGYVKTDMTSHNGLIEAPESVSGMLKVIERVGVSESGSFWHANGEPLPW